jgi:DNA repair protein SbcC/Rad50
MKKIIFKKYGAENFGIFREKIELEIQNEKLFMICGPNGTGKTTTLDIIPFTLYGVTSKGTRGDAVVNDTIGKNCHSWLEFDILEEEKVEEYRIDRYQKHSKFGSTVILKCGNTPIRKGSKEYTPMIESLLLPQKLFFNSLFFGQKVKNFFTDLTDSDQKEIFRKVLRLDEYVDFYNNSKEFLTEVEKNYSTNENEVSKCEQIINDYKENIILLEKKKKEFEEQKISEMDNLILRLNKAELDLEKIKEILNKYSEEEFKNKILSLREQLNTRMAEITTINLEISQLEDSIKNKYKQKENDLNMSYEQKKNTIQTEKSEVEKIYEKQISDIRIEKQKYLSDLKVDWNNVGSKHTNNLSMIKRIQDDREEYRLGIVDGDICPTCKQPITEECKTEMMLKLDKYDLELKEIEEENKKITNELMILKSSREEKEKEFEKTIIEIGQEKTTKIFDLNEKLRLLKEKKEEVFNTISQMIATEIKEGKESNTKKVDELKNNETYLLEEIKKNEGYIEKLQKYKIAEAQFDSEISSLNELIKQKTESMFDSSTMDHLSKEKTSLEEKLKLSEVKKLVLLEDKEIISFWKTAFSPRGIPSMLIDNAIPFMNKNINNYLEKLSNGRLIVSIDTLKETAAGEYRDKISISVIDTHTKANSRQKLSGGQIRQVDIATLLTLYDLQSEIYHMSFNIMIFDEIFDSLDDNNIGLASSVLRQLCQDTCVFIISHRHISQIDADEVLAFNT